jgi:DNA polymerase III epsilon subunit-like protein
MFYIVFDLEFNQDFSSLQNFPAGGNPRFEIIQIGAVKLDANLHATGTFDRYVKPTFYDRIDPFITKLTGISTEQLLNEETFPDVYKAFIEFIGATDAVFCNWGMSDISGLFKNAAYHQLDDTLLPHLFIDLQPYVSAYLGLPRKSIAGLNYAVKAMDIPTAHAFHDALNDANYTAEIFKKIYQPSIQPIKYHPHYVPDRVRQQKREIDTEKLIQQFEKMYTRNLTAEEKEIILLAYKMGRTQQFLK